MKDDLLDFLDCTRFEPIYVWICTMARHEKNTIKIGHQLHLKYLEQHLKDRFDISTFLSHQEIEKPEYTIRSNGLRRQNNQDFLNELLEFEKNQTQVCYRYLTYHAFVVYQSVYDNEEHKIKLVLQIDLEKLKIISFQMSYMPRSTNMFANNFFNDVQHLNDNLNLEFLQQLYDRHIERIST